MSEVVGRLFEGLPWCGDIRGFLKYGGSYWWRMRRIDRWQAERKNR